MAESDTVASASIPNQAVLGTWNYKHHFYEISFGDGHYVFFQEVTGAKGVLEQGSEWLEGHVNLGIIRLRLHDDGAMLSQFKPDGKDEWGSLIESRKLSLAVEAIVSGLEAPRSPSIDSEVSPTCCEALGAVRLHVYAVVLIATGLPAAATVLCTSDFTPLGQQVYDFLVHSYMHPSGIELCYILLTIGTALLFLGFLFDLHRWRGWWHASAMFYFSIAAVCFIFGSLFYTKAMPMIPIIAGIAVTIVSAVFCRTTLFAKEHGEHYSLGASVAFLFLSLVCAITWVLWAFTPLMGGSHKWRIEDSDADKNTRLIRFVRWSSPMILSMAYFLIFCQTLVVSRFLRSSNTRPGAIDAGEIKVVLWGFASCFLLAWIGATLLVYDMELSKSIVRVAAVWFIGTAIYVALSTGLGRIRMAAESNRTFQLMVESLNGAWFHGLFLLIFWPFLPAYFCIEILHKMNRTRLLNLGIVRAELGAEAVTDWLTAPAWHLWYEMTQIWDRGAVLLWSMYLGIIFFLVQVCFVFGLTLFLSWTNERMAALPLWSIVLGLYLLGLVLFMLPPCPGSPVYLLAAMIITSRFLTDEVGGSEEIGFWIGIGASSLFCFLLKMSAIAMEQKFIGEPFATNVNIKKMIGVQTAQIKSVRHILKKPGMPVDKVAVLVGGPDWPTSVLTGVLRLRLADMLLGSSPVAFIIVPIVLAAAFQVRAGQDHPNATLYQSMATILMMVATLVQIAAFMMAGYYMQVEADEHRDESDWEVDSQEDDVNDSIELDSHRSRMLEKVTGWTKMPILLKFILFAGSIMTSLMFHLVVDPFFYPFKEFTITDSISDLPGGNPISLINRTGWWAISLFCAVVAIIAMHEFWCWFKTKDLPELLPLAMNAKQSRRPSAYARSGSICEEDPRRFSRGSRASNASIIVGTYSTMREGD